MTSTEPTSALPLTPGNELPIHLTRFVGRDRELDDLSRLVGTTRQGEVPIDVPFVQVWTVRDGRLARMRGFMDTAVLARAIDQGRRAAH